jgi:hypothetical protein
MHFSVKKFIIFKTYSTRQINIVEFWIKYFHLIMSPLRTKGTIYIVCLIFFFRFFSAKLVQTITFLSFQIGQLYFVCGCMTIRRCVTKYHWSISKDKNVMARTRKYCLKNYYLTLRSTVKVPRRSLWYATHRLMVMHPHTKYNWPIWKDKKVMVEKKRKKKWKKKSGELLSPLSVRRLSSVVHPSVNFSHFNQLLLSHWANLNQTLVEWFLDGSTCVLHTLWLCLLYKLYKVLFMMMAPNSDHLENISTTYIFFYNHSDQPCKWHGWSTILINSS